MWSKLPLELWGKIGQDLDCVLDKARCRSVCKLWHSSFPSLATRIPIKIPSPLNDETNTSYVLKERTIYHIKGDCHFLQDKLPIIIVLEQVNHDDNYNREGINKVEFRVYNLFHERRMVNVFPKEFNVINQDLISFSYVSKYYMIESSQKRSRIWKIAVINNVVAAILDVEQGGKLAVLKRTHSRLSGDVMQWEIIHNTRKWDDIVEYKGNFFVVDRYGKGYILDHVTLKVSKIVPPILNRYSIFEFELKGYELVLRRKRLVVDVVTNNLYLLIPFNYRPKKIERYTGVIRIYKLSVNCSEWNEVLNIGNCTLVVGRDFSFCSWTKDMFRDITYNSNSILCDRDSSFELYEGAINNVLFYCNTDSVYGMVEYSIELRKSTWIDSDINEIM